MNSRNFVIIIFLYTVVIYFLGYYTKYQIDFSKGQGLLRQGEAIIVKTDKNILITDKSVKVSKKGSVVIVDSKFTTEDLGNVVITTPLDIKTLIPKHNINIGFLGLINTRTMLLDVGYSYKCFGLSVYGGYSFEIRDWEYGLGVSYTFKF